VAGSVASFSSGDSAALQQPRVLRFITRFAPVDIGELCKRTFGRGVVETERDEATVFVEGIAEAKSLAFEFVPVGAEAVGGHAEDEDAGAVEAVLDFGGDVVTWKNFPSVEPDAEVATP